MKIPKVRAGVSPNTFVHEGVVIETAATQTS